MRILILCSFLMLSACAAPRITEYRVSASNVEKLRERKNVKSAIFGVEKYSSTLENKAGILCRGSDLKTMNGNTISEYIENATKEELKLINLYSEAGKPIRIDFDFIDVNSWSKNEITISGTVTVGAEKYPVKYAQKFNAPFSGYDACNNAAMAFPDAVSGFLGLVYEKL